MIPLHPVAQVAKERLMWLPQRHRTPDALRALVRLYAGTQGLGDAATIEALHAEAERAVPAWAWAGRR